MNIKGGILHYPRDILQEAVDAVFSCEEQKLVDKSCSSVITRDALLSNFESEHYIRPIKGEWNECPKWIDRKYKSSTTFSHNECQIYGHGGQVQAGKSTKSQEEITLNASSEFSQYTDSDEWTLPYFDIRFELDENMNVCVPALTSKIPGDIVSESVMGVLPYDEYSCSLVYKRFPSNIHLYDALTYLELRYHDDIDSLMQNELITWTESTWSPSRDKIGHFGKQMEKFWCCDCEGWIVGSKLKVAKHLRTCHNDVECKVIHVTRSGLHKMTKSKFLATVGRSRNRCQAMAKKVVHYECKMCRLWIDGGEMMVCDHLETFHPNGDCEIFRVCKSTSLILSKNEFLSKYCSYSDR